MHVKPKKSGNNNYITGVHLREAKYFGPRETDSCINREVEVKMSQTALNPKNAIA